MLPAPVIYSNQDGSKLGKKKKKKKEKTNHDFAVVTDTSKDALTHPANDTGRVAGALVHAKLDVFPAEEERTSAEENGAGLGCETRAGAALGEEEGDGLVEEGLGGETEL